MFSDCLPSRALKRQVQHLQAPNMYSLGISVLVAQEVVVVVVVPLEDLRKEGQQLGAVPHLAHLGSARRVQDQSDRCTAYKLQGRTV